MSKFYVYTVLLDGAVIYVGKGTGKRSDHVLSGKSSNRLLNEFFYRHKLLGESLPVVTIVSRHSKESLALKKEDMLIKEFNPICNVAGKGKGVKESNKGELTTFLSKTNSEDVRILLDCITEGENPRTTSCKDTGRLLLDKEWYEGYSKQRKGFYHGIDAYLDAHKVIKVDGNYAILLC